MSFRLRLGERSWAYGYAQELLLRRAGQSRFLTHLLQCDLEEAVHLKPVDCLKLVSVTAPALVPVTAPGLAPSKLEWVASKSKPGALPRQVSSRATTKPALADFGLPATRAPARQGPGEYCT